MNAPKLRFKDENWQTNSDWTIVFLEELISEIYQGLNTTSDLKYTSDGIPFLQAKHITNGYIDKNDIKYLDNEIYSKQKTKYSPDKNNILFTNRGTIGKSLFIDEKCDFMIAWNIMLIKVDETKINAFLLYSFISYLEEKGLLLALQTGNATKFIKKETLLSQRITIPSNKVEQNKMATFFMLLNQKIDIQLEKIEKLKELKKGMMQKTFSQELRFKDENGREFPDWETRILKGEVDFFNNQRQPITENLRQKGKYPYYGATGIIDYVKEYIFEGEYLLLAEDGANIVTRSAPVVYKTKNKFWVNNHAHIMKPKASNDYNFFYQVLENINYVPYNSGTAQPKLNVESVKKITLILPKYKEQHKIGVLLSSIDNKIEKEKEKLMVLKSQKKGFLQGMFV